MALALNARRAGKVEPFVVPVGIEVRFGQKPGGVLADTGNYMPTSKAVIDGIVDAKLIPDDSGEHVQWITFMPTFRSDNPGVQVTLIPQED